MSIPLENTNQGLHGFAGSANTGPEPVSVSNTTTDYSDSAFSTERNPANTQPRTLDKLMTKLSNKTFNGSSRASIANLGRSAWNNKKPAPKKKMTDDGLWAGLIKMIVSALKLPGKFKYIINAIDGAGKSLAFGIDGFFLSSYLAVKDIMAIMIALLGFIVKYLTCIIKFFVTLPFCFIPHIIWCFAKLFRMFLAFLSCMCWYATGMELTPAYDRFFGLLDYADDTVIFPMLGFYLTKFPPSIQKLCYTCNNKPVRLKDISRDTGPIVRAGKQFGSDMGVKIPRYMRPAKPHMRKVAINIDKLFKKS